MNTTATPSKAKASEAAPVTPKGSANNGSTYGMLAPDAVGHRAIRDLVSPEEWQMRVDLAAAYRLMDHYGMTEMIYNHITARVPGAPEQFLINAYGLHYSEITASNLHKIDEGGEFVLRGNSHYGVNYPGFIIHGAVHAARPDIVCVIHSHSTEGVAVSSMKEGLMPLCLLGMRFAGNIGYHDCEGTVVNIEERASLARDLGPHNAMLLRHHGVIACGPTVAEAFNTHYMIERACKVQVAALSAGTAELLMPAQEAVDATAKAFRPESRRAYGVMEWEALLRLLDRKDPSYKT
jgi:ribulose-5-phosphate 4-epimerase/fuculose-1-phosphate aldolase